MKTCHRYKKLQYFTNPVASYYLQCTLGDVDINFRDLAKLPKPLSGCLSKKQLDEIRQWVQQYGKSVRQNTTRNFSTKDKPGTLPLNLYESAPPEQHSVDFDVLLNEDIPVQHQDTSTARNIVIAQSTYVVVSRIYKPRSAPNSPLYITKPIEDLVDDYDSARYVTTLCYTQDVVDPLLFTTSGEEHVIPKEGIKGVVSSIAVVENETFEIDEGEYYLLLALANGSTDTTSPNQADEERFAESVYGQGDEDSITKEAEEDSEPGVSLLLRSDLFIFRYLVFCFKIILGIWYHTFYDFEVYWYLWGKIAGILVSYYPPGRA